MSSWLGSIAKGAAYLYGGGGDNEDEQENKNDTPSNNNNDTENKQIYNDNTNNNTHQQYVPENIYSSATGELWKFNPKREEFKLLLNEVRALVIEHDTSGQDFISSFQIIRKNGDLLFSEQISNELQIQYNKSNHSMVFAMYNATKDRLEILSFIFSNATQEEEFKMAIAIKLYETNRQESFDKLLKKNDIKQDETQWMTSAYEMDNNNNNNNYMETDTDLQELCQDVNMLDMSNAFDISNNDSFDIGDDYEEEKQNKWQTAANKQYDNEDELKQHTDNILPDSPFKDEKQSKFASNKHITGSKLFNRTYVVREMNPHESALGYFKHNDENELEYQGKINIKDINNKHFTPTKILQHKSDRNMLLLDGNRNTNDSIHVLNLDKGKIIEEWNICENLNDITPLIKHNEMTDNSQIYGLNNNSMFQIDSRIPNKNKIIDSKQKNYKSIHNLNVIATSGNGFIATGSNDGKIRMHNDISKKAKTCLPGLGNGIKYLEISDNGQWILGTCKDYILVIPTQVPGTERTGFEGRGMGKLKPSPYVLRLKYSDIQKYKLRNVNFTHAHFDQGKSINEHWIISSTGPYIIKWNFNKLKKSGVINSYSIRKAKSNVIHNEFRFNYNDDLLVTETNSVYAQHSSKKKK